MALVGRGRGLVDCAHRRVAYSGRRKARATSAEDKAPHSIEGRHVDLAESGAGDEVGERCLSTAPPPELRQTPVALDFAQRRRAVTAKLPPEATSTEGIFPRARSIATWRGLEMSARVNFPQRRIASIVDNGF